MRKQLYVPVEGHKLYEYLLIISPDETTSARTSEIKSIFSEKYGCTKAVNLKPHITLVKFVLYDSAEFRILNCFERFAKGIEPFNIVLNGFDGFDSHTIYVKLEVYIEVVNLVEKLKLRFNNLLGTVEGFESKFITRPHLTIAREMTPEQHAVAWSRWKKEDFTGEFRVNEMRLIRRELNPKNSKVLGSYKPIQDFIFSAQFTEEQLVLAL